MAEFAEATADALKNWAELVKRIVDSPIGKAIGPTLSDLVQGQNYGEIFGLTPYSGSSFNPTVSKVGRARRFFAGGQDSIQESLNNKAREKAEREAAKREKDRIKREKELAALAKKNLEAQRKALALSKAAKTLDLERIGIEAALKGEISKTDRLSLNLQLALLDKNDAAATKLSGQLSEAVKRQAELAALLLATPKAPNPYEDWKVPKLDFGGNLLGSPSYTNPYTPDAGFLAGISGQKQPVINIEVIVDGEAVGGAVRNSSVNSSLSGSFNSVNRVGRFGEIATP
jgi:hypothetical protein